MRTNHGFAALVRAANAPARVDVLVRAAAVSMPRRGGCLAFVGALIWAFAVYAAIRF